jgi:hypothetical protein
VADKAKDQWNLLEAQPEIAAPWRQLFSQVQSPRHVLSELLQNAEDAKATSASCMLDGGEFRFEHNGRDFDESALASLCRFGYSNKRSLQTIGFRGVGFKTTFSIGPRVTVRTPSLAFRFEKDRFTYPEWIGGERNGLTSVTIPIADSDRQKAVEDSLSEWSQSPIPLLFFSSIESLALGDHKIAVVDRTDGPVPNSAWITLSAASVHKVLLVRSCELPLPEECVQEIREERNATDFESGDCRVEIVFDPSLKGRVYSVLPTTLLTDLPFAFNAPFVQDPSRYGIKDPSRSPTNRWLLERVGTLAAETLLGWVSNMDLNVEERAQAYSLLASTIKNQGGGLQGAIRELVIDAMFNGLNVGPCLLTQDGDLSDQEDVADIPGGIVESLGAEAAIKVFGGGRSLTLHARVAEESRDALEEWELLQRSNPAQVLAMLDRCPTVPRPEGHERLAAFWAAVAGLHARRTVYHRFDYPIVPTEGGQALLRAQDVTRFVASDDRLTSEELALLRRHVQVLDRAFVDFLKPEEEELPEWAEPALSSARECLQRLDFETSSLQRLFDQASRAVSSQAPRIEDSMLLVSIAAKTGLTVPTTFKYFCRDSVARSVDAGLLVPDERYEGDLLPTEWLSGRAIDQRYLELTGIPRLTLVGWLDSPKSRLRRFPAPERVDEHFYSSTTVRSLVGARGGTKPDLGNCRYWIFRDARWNEGLVKHWDSLAKGDDETWARVAEAWCEAWRPEDVELATSRMLRQWGGYVPKKCSENLVSTWLHRLRDERCLFEEKSGRPEFPSALMRLTQATRNLQQVERFVHSRIDRAEASDLLDLLGVRSEPDNADKLLTRLKQLAQSGQPPLTALLDLYRAIDGTIERLNEHEREVVRQSFAEQRLILGQDGAWHDVHGVFQSNDDGIPGAAVVHVELRSLSLWDRVGVGRVPSLEKALEWLEELPEEKSLPEADLRRLKASLPRLAVEAWHEIGKWLTIGGEWVPVGSLRYYVGERGEDGQPRTKLFPAFSRLTADFSMLPSEQLEGLRADLTSWDEAVTYEVADKHGAELPLPQWISDVASCVLRAERPVTYRDETLWARGQDVAAKMREFRFIHAKEIAVAPYIGGTQAGAEILVRAIVRDGTAYVSGSEPSYTSELVQGLEGFFDARELKLAVRYCSGRSSAWIEDYFSERFTLGAPIVEEPPVGRAPARVPSASTTPEAPSQPSEPQTVAGSAEEIEETPVLEEAHAPLNDLLAFLPTASPPQAPRPAPRRRPIEMLLESYDFVAAEGSCFYRSEDRLTVRRESTSGPWRLTDINGTDLGRFLELSDPVESSPTLKAEDWLLVQKMGSRCWLLAVRGDGTLQAIRGDRAMGELKATAANYRITGSVSEDAQETMPF